MTDVYFLESFGFPNGDLHNLGFIIQNLFINFVVETFDMVFTERGFDVIRSDADTYRNMVLRKNDIENTLGSDAFQISSPTPNLIKYFLDSSNHQIVMFIKMILNLLLGFLRVNLKDG